jgi:hypothetical protein
MAESPPGGVTPPTTPEGTGVTPTPPPTPPPEPTRDAGTDGTTDDDARRDAGASVDDLRKALNAERRSRRELDREIRALREADKAREDASKTDLERAVERANAAEARASALERQAEATKIAAEFQVSEWAEELAGDPDARAMRAHAQRIRDRLGLRSGGMDGGVRSTGVPPAPQSMDDMIRRGFGRN